MPSFVSFLQDLSSYKFWKSSAKAHLIDKNAFSKEDEFLILHLDSIQTSFQNLTDLFTAVSIKKLIRNLRDVYQFCF